MKGIRLMRLLEVLSVTAATNAPGVSPRSLLVTCPVLQAVDQVLMNGLASPEFAVYSDTQLIAQVPDALSDAIITDVAVLSSVPTMTQRSLIELGVGARVAGLRGTQRLLQTFVRLLLRTAGSNLFHPELGGGLLRLVGQNLGGSTAADIAIAVAAVKRQILAAQASHTGLPLSERLLNAEIANFTEDPASATVYVTIVLTAHDRQRSAATLIS